MRICYYLKSLKVRFASHSKLFEIFCSRLLPGLSTLLIFSVSEIVESNPLTSIKAFLSLLLEGDHGLYLSHGFWNLC